MHWDNDKDSKEQPMTKVIRPPPIKITDEKHSLTTIKQILTTLNITEFSAKIISIGIKIDLDKKDDFVIFIDKLKLDQINFSP